jgi:SAM-dependent MidA family methyltransferase
MWLSWREATERALYGDSGFYRLSRGDRHFRTSVSASASFAMAVHALVGELDSDAVDVVDVGAGSGALLAELHRLCGNRSRLTGVEVGARPAGLAPEIGWTDTLPETITGLVLANEWLDNVPVEVVEQTPDGPRCVLVDPSTGAERLGAPPGAADLAWLDRWWPLASAGDRAEVGRAREAAWADVVRRLDGGLAVAVDYAHRLGSRPAGGSLTGYRDGRIVRPVPDGSCDITAHVALDACAAAGIAAGATGSVLIAQRDALRALGILGRRPSFELAHTDPRGYLAALRRAGEEGELLDRDGLGGFTWLVQSVGGCLPPALSATMKP